MQEKSEINSGYGYDSFNNWNNKMHLFAVCVKDLFLASLRHVKTKRNLIAGSMSSTRGFKYFQGRYRIARIANGFRPAYNSGVGAFFNSRQAHPAAIPCVP